MEYKIRLRKTGGKKVYVDPLEEEGFYLYPGEIRKAGLEDGMILSREDFETMRQEYAVTRAKRRALFLLSKRDMCEKELADRLVRSPSDSRSVAAAMAFVTGHGYVDDTSYVRDYFSSRRGKKSFRQIREELIRKGIPGDIIREYLEEEGEQSPEDILPLLEKYAAKFPEWDDVAEQKIINHFGRKGYRIRMIREIFREMRDHEEGR